MVRDHVEGHIEVGTSGRGEVVINTPDMRPSMDENGIAHFMFSPRQARALAMTLMKKAGEAADEEPEAIKQLVDNLKPRVTLPRGFHLWSENQQLTWLRANQKKEENARG